MELFQVRKYRVAPTVRGFHVGELADNTLYLVCVITRGSSYTRSPNEIVTTTSRKQQVTLKICLVQLLTLMTALAHI